MLVVINGEFSLFLQIAPLTMSKKALWAKHEWLELLGALERSFEILALNSCRSGIFLSRRLRKRLFHFRYQFPRSAKGKTANFLLSTHRQTQWFFIFACMSAGPTFRNARVYIFICNAALWNASKWILVVAVYLSFSLREGCIVFETAGI